MCQHPRSRDMCQKGFGPKDGSALPVHADGYGHMVPPPPQELDRRDRPLFRPGYTVQVVMPSDSVEAQIKTRVQVPFFQSV